jgi:hypothetical protein
MTTESYYIPIKINPDSNIVDHYNLVFEVRNRDIFTTYEHHFDAWYETIHNSAAVDNCSTNSPPNEPKTYHKYIYIGKYYRVAIAITELDTNGESFSVKITIDPMKKKEFSILDMILERDSIVNCAKTCREDILAKNAYINREYLEDLSEECKIEYARGHMQ